MLARSMTTRFAPDRISAQTWSPNSFAVMLSIRPFGSTVETPSDCPTRISIPASSSVSTYEAPDIRLLKLSQFLFPRRS